VFPPVSFDFRDSMISMLYLTLVPTDHGDGT
jgi:hypothetical protein